MINEINVRRRKRPSAALKKKKNSSKFGILERTYHKNSRIHNYCGGRNKLLRVHNCPSREDFQSFSALIEECGEFSDIVGKSSVSYRWKREVILQKKKASWLAVDQIKRALKLSSHKISKILSTIVWNKLPILYFPKCLT